jgi:hypothetical protein
MKRIGYSLTAILVAALFWANLAHATAWTIPTLPPVGPTDQASRQQGALNGGGTTQTGSLVISPIGTPAAPTVTTNGTAGVTSLVYACTGVDINGNATIPSATTTITTANATLTTTNSVNITCAGKTGALAFLIHKADTAHVLGICYTTSGASCTYVDNGSVATTFTYTANTIDQTGKISGAITPSGSGIVTVRAAATNVASPITMCTTSGLNGACTEPTIVLVPGFADTAYTVTCSCTGSNTAVPELVSIVKASNSLVVGIVSAGATPSASCAEIDCTAIHD